MVQCSGIGIISPNFFNFIIDETIFVLPQFVFRLHGYPVGTISFLLRNLCIGEHASCQFSWILQYIQRKVFHSHFQLELFCHLDTYFHSLPDYL